MSIRNFTKTAQSTGPENIGPQRTLPSRLSPRPVKSPVRITFENNKNIRLKTTKKTGRSRIGEHTSRS